jgi:hypothetical protein
MPYPVLNLPAYNLKIIRKANKLYVFDNIRKKYILLTPEEWVRQNFTLYLIKDKKYPASLISLEFSFELNGLNKRSDIAVYSKNGEILLLVECKSPYIKINQSVFDQIFVYNVKIKAPYLIVTNGLEHYCCRINENSNQDGQSITYMEFIPEYEKLIQNQD